jgi:ABC-type enterochelin transport system permease subunit
VIAAVAVVVLGVFAVILLRENRRLTNLLLAKNPAVAVAMEQSRKPRKQDRDDNKPRSAWQTPVEAVGP